MKIRTHWFYKMLFSYLPILFMISSVLFLLFFIAFNEYIKKSTLRANQVYAEQVTQSVDNYLLPIDKVIVHEILIDGTFKDFFGRREAQSYTLYLAHQYLKNFVSSFPMIDSAYIYRHWDGMVLSDYAYTPVGDFADRAFIDEQMDHREPVSWTGRRTYVDTRHPTGYEVVSLVRKVPLSTGMEGIVVVNVRISSLLEFVASMSGRDVSFVKILDRQSEMVISTEPSHRDADDGNALVSATSPYTQWTVQSGLLDRQVSEFLSSFPYFWVAMGVICTLAGSVLIFIVTRRHYKPIETIIDRIHAVFLQQKQQELFAKEHVDEMRFIQLAIDSLAERANKFQDQFEEDMVRIRRNLFLEVLEGGAPIRWDRWQREMKRLGLPGDFDQVGVGLLEIDKYNEFCREYSDRDQYLLKFVVHSVLHEISNGQDARVWTEWISGSQLGMFWLLNRGEDEAKTVAQLRRIGDKTVAWARTNVKFTVTIGIGGLTATTEEIPQLYDHALDALQYKSTIGGSRVIHYADVPSRPRSDIYNHVQLIYQLALSFRLGENSWRERYRELMAELRDGWFGRDDVKSMLNYLIYYLDREVTSLAPPIPGRWRTDVLPELTRLLEQFETIDEFDRQTFRILSDVHAEAELTRANRGNRQLIHNMRKYIEEHYADPNLSLDHLYDAFHLNKRYLSKLFKDEFGESFVDYLMRIRMEKAKELLRETTLPVQEIATKVGYVHSFSFIRVFKKAVGVTPGDFRK